MAVKMQARQFIKIRGANENNLKNLDVDIPRNGRAYRAQRFGKEFSSI